MSAMEQRNSILGGFFWRFGERILAQGASFIVSLIIARILDPSAYGMISILLVFINIADALVTSGMGNALIQKKDCDETDFSSVFYFNIVFSMALYVIIFVAAPYIENWYGTDYVGMTSALRVLAIRIPISAINNVQQAYVSRKMIFKKFFFATLGGTIGSAVIGITLACTGFGVWALVFQYLFNAAVDTLVLWFTVKWRPHLVFSFKKLCSLIKFGWKLMAGSLLEVVYNDLRTVLIGKVYTSDDLAYYNRGKQFPGLVIDNINTAILGVMFPALCSIQDEKNEIKNLERKSIRTASYIISPMLIGLAVVSDRLVLVLLTEKWMPAVWFVRAFCIIYLLQPIAKPLQQVINATGRSDLSLKLQIVGKVFGIVGVVISMNFGVKAVAIAHILTSTISGLMDMYFGGKLIGYSVLEQVRDVAPGIIYSGIMGVCVYFIGALFSAFNNIGVLALQVVVGGALYLLISLITQDESFKYLVNKGIAVLRTKRI